MGKIIGIDLGTTNSVVAVMEGDSPTVIANPEGGAHHAVGRGLHQGRASGWSGQVAKRQAVTNPENTIYSIKRFMGRKFSEVSEETKMVPYKVVQAPNGDVRVEVRASSTRPPEISAMILQKMKDAAEQLPGREGHRRRSSPSRRTSTTPSARPPRTRARSRAWTCCAS